MSAKDIVIEEQALEEVAEALLLGCKKEEKVTEDERSSSSSSSSSSGSSSCSFAFNLFPTPLHLTPEVKVEPCGNREVAWLAVAAAAAARLPELLTKPAPPVDLSHTPHPTYSPAEADSAMWALSLGGTAGGGAQEAMVRVVLDPVLLAYEA
jgi:hypothetical protein